VPKALHSLGGAVNLTSRDHLTLWRSSDDGGTFQKESIIDAGASGYSSLQVAADENGCDDVYVLYEQADPAPEHPVEEALVGDIAVLDPDRFVLSRRTVC